MLFSYQTWNPERTMTKLVIMRSFFVLVVIGVVLMILWSSSGFYHRFLPTLLPLSRDVATIDLSTDGRTLSSDFVESPDELLQAQFLQHLNDLSFNEANLFNVSCQRGQVAPCFQAPCNATFPPAETRLAELLGSQYPLEEHHRRAVDQLTDYTAYADIVFVIGASSDHYQEYHGVFKGLFTQIFPRLRTEARYSFKLVCYDLGLDRAIVEKMANYCTSIVRFPFELLPPSFRFLHGYQWKPLVIAANVFKSKVTIWLDASVRFHNDNLTEVLNHILQRGFYIWKANEQMPRHVAVPTLQYFHVKPCLLSAFREMGSGFVGIRNDVVMRRAVLGPWVACAFSPQCLCPGKKCYGPLHACNHRLPGYSICHRYDQATVGVILVKLYGWKATSFYSNRPTNLYRFDRHRFFDFPEMNVKPKA